MTTRSATTPRQVTKYFTYSGFLQRFFPNSAVCKKCEKLGFKSRMSKCWRCEEYLCKECYWDHTLHCETYKVTA